MAVSDLARRLLLGALLGALAAPALAVELETLVMPGEVVRAHADIESDCGRCHRPFHADEQNALCLDCHEEVAADRKAGTGFHGRLPAAPDPACRSCHGEHRGRDADIRGLYPETFDHALTDFALHGAHTRQPCAACHPADRARREAPLTCAGCHREGDPHRGALGTACADCHSQDTWSEARFDHSTTGFALKGGHRDLDCGACHPNRPDGSAGRYAEASPSCASCHSLDDEHGGRLGPRCESCHTTSSWSAPRFDHAGKTGYPLLGRHARAACAACHTGDRYDDPIETECQACHGADDEHRGLAGPDCGRCHGPAGWLPADFDHARDTKFPLSGAHAAATCRQCHVDPFFQRAPPTDCGGCHRSDDPHGGEQTSDCGRCHRETSWRASVVFDHELSRFPLLGFHAVTACEECHADSVFRETSRECQTCHVSEDVHAGALSQDCGRCHNPNGWNLWRFEHDTQTSFPLHGAHTGLECKACHLPASGATGLTSGGTSGRVSDRCVSCHASDDVHRGAYGESCERCHGEARWQEILIGR